MKHELEFKNFQPTSDMRNRIETGIAHLKRKLHGIEQNPLFLRIVLEGIPEHKRFRVTLTLTVPGKVLAAKEETYDADTAIRAAFDEIEKQLAAYKSSLRGEHWWKRIQRRLELKQQSARGSQTTLVEDPQWFFSLVEPHRETLRDVVGKVLRFAEARGDLPPHYLEVDDAVDAALTRAYDEFSRKKTTEDIRSRIMRFALDEIKAAVISAKVDRERFVHIEDDIPETAAAGKVTNLGEEILYFYQPDEDLRVEEILADEEVALPSENGESEELRRCVRSALGEIPEDARRALTLRYIVGLQGPELAKSIGKTQSEVERLLKIARSALHEQLAAAGCITKRDGPAAA